MKTEISKYIGIPYKLNGRDCLGTDCLGLVWLYLRDQGINFPSDDGAPIDENWKGDGDAESRFIKGLDAVAERVTSPRKNDIVLIHCLRQAAHIGVMLDNQYMLHSPGSQGSEKGLVSSYGKHRIIGYWRLREQEG